MAIKNYIQLVIGTTIFKMMKNYMSRKYIMT